MGVAARDNGRMRTTNPDDPMLAEAGDAQRWRAIQGVLARLDQPARQVVIEVTIAEVTLTDELEHGVEWALRNVGMSAVERLGWIEACLDLGITTFDHADIYGGYTVEARFGEA